MRSKLVISLSGNFFKATGKDAVVIHNLLGYRLISDKNDANIGEWEIGFPKSGLGKVSVALTEAGIPFEVYDGERTQTAAVVTVEGAYEKYSRLTTTAEIAVMLDHEADIQEKKYGTDNRRKGIMMRNAAKMVREYGDSHDK